MSPELVSREEILPLLVNPKQLGSEWVMSNCPAHEDTHRSLGLSKAGVLQCFRGCTFKEIMTALRKNAPVGYDSNTRQPTSPLPPKTSTPIKAERAEFTLIESYDYKDVTGKVIAQKGRFESIYYKDDKQKEFKWRLPGQQGWPGLGGKLTMEDIPIWGADEVAEWDEDDWIILCEGEKATLACRAVGLHAVTFGGGAGSTAFGLAFAPLAGRKVALWPDNDDPGRRYMRRVYNELLPIAKEIKFLFAPVKVKGDAFDYFAEGGSVESLWKQEFKEPLVEVIAFDCIKVTLNVETFGPVTFRFESIAYIGRYELMSLVTVEAVTPGIAEAPLNLRLNLESTSGRAQWITQVQKYFGGQAGKNNEWTVPCNIAVSKCKDAFVNQQRAVKLVSIAEPTTMPFLLDEFLPEHEVTVVFGDGEGGKTTMCYAMGLSVATGAPILGVAARKRPVLIFDYESKEAGSRLRMGRIVRGAGYSDLPDNIHYWWGAGIPFVEQLETLKRQVREDDIGLLIVDSAAPACGGSPEGSAETVMFFNALNQLGCTTIVIAHSNKSDASGFTRSLKPLGSVAWHNLPRKTYLVESTKGPNVTDLVMVPCKTNNDGRRSPLGFKLSYIGDQGVGPIQIDASDWRSMTGFEHLLPSTERILAVLKTEDRPMAHIEIMQALGWQGDDQSARMSKLLKWGNDNQWFERTTGKNGGTLWQVHPMKK